MNGKNVSMVIENCCAALLPHIEEEEVRACLCVCVGGGGGGGVLVSGVGVWMERV